MLAHWIEDYVTINGHRFHYTRTGQGNKPPVVLLHGFSDNGLCWLRVARDLEDQYDLILPDARGHGLSTRLGPGEEIDNAADAAALITTLGLDKPVVGGHSMGGSSATALGARFPELVGGLILEDPAWIDSQPEPEPQPENLFHKWLMEIENVPAETVIAGGKAMNPLWAEDEFPAWADSKQQLDKTILGRVNISPDWRELVAKLTAPTLLLLPDPAMNGIVSQEAAEEAVSLSPSIQTVQVPNAGHNIRRENYAVFIVAVRTFLSQLTIKDD